MADSEAAVGEARFSLIFRGEKLDFDGITAQIALTPTATVRRGEVLNRLPRIEAQEDEWMYAIPLTTPEGADAELNALLTHVASRREEIAALASAAQVTMRLYVQSDRAQIAYRLMPETLRKLVETGLPLDLTSLSWGEIGM